MILLSDWFPISSTNLMLKCPFIDDPISRHRLRSFWHCVQVRSNVASMRSFRTQRPGPSHVTDDEGIFNIFNISMKSPSSVLPVGIKLGELYQLISPTIPALVLRLSTNESPTNRQAIVDTPKVAQREADFFCEKTPWSNHWMKLG